MLTFQSRPLQHIWFRKWSIINLLQIKSCPLGLCVFNAGLRPISVVDTWPKTLDRFRWAHRKSERTLVGRISSAWSSISSTAPFGLPFAYIWIKSIRTNRSLHGPFFISVQNRLLSSAGRPREWMQSRPVVFVGTGILHIAPSLVS